MYDTRFIGPMPDEGWYNTFAAANGANDQPWLCDSCGIRPTTKITSGSPECSYCWDWRKLNGPAARHWYAVGRHFLSNIDMYDWNDFLPAAGLTKDEAATMIKAADKLVTYCEAQIKEHTPWLDTEEKQAKALTDLAAQRATDFATTLKGRTSQS